MSSSFAARLWVTTILLALVPAPGHAEDIALYCATSEYVAVAAKSNSGVHLWVISYPSRESEEPAVSPLELNDPPLDLACADDGVFLRLNDGVRFSRVGESHLTSADEFPTSSKRTFPRAHRMKAGRLYLLPRSGYGITLMRARSDEAEVREKLVALFLLTPRHETLLSTLHLATITVD
jgi:hypothetical protein